MWNLNCGSIGLDNLPVEILYETFCTENCKYVQERIYTAFEINVSFIADELQSMVETIYDVQKQGV